MFQKMRAWFHQKTVLEATHLLKHQVNEELAKKAFTAAEKTLRKILDLGPNEEDALVTLSQVLLQQKKIDEGYAVLQKAITLNPAHTPVTLDFVQGYEEAGKLEKMREILYAAVQNAPDMVELRLYLAQQLFENAMIQEAESELTEIVKRVPHHPEANIGLAHCHINAGRKIDALEQVSKIRQWDAKKADELMSAIYENVQNFN